MSTLSNKNWNRDHKRYQPYNSVLFPFSYNPRNLGDNEKDNFDSVSTTP